MKLSIVTTLFSSENYIQEFYERASSVANKIVGDDSGSEHSHESQQPIEWNPTI